MEVETGLANSLSSRTMQDISSQDERWRWTIVRSCLQEKPLFDHQLQSYNDFITRGLQRLVDEDPVLEVIADPTPGAVTIDGSLRRARIRFGQVTVVKPRTRVKPPKVPVAGGWARQDVNGGSVQESKNEDGPDKFLGWGDDPCAASREDQGWGSPDSKKDVGWGASGEGQGWGSPKENKGAGWTAQDNMSSGWCNGEASNAWEDTGKDMDMPDAGVLKGTSKKDECCEQGKNSSGYDEVTNGAKASKGKDQVGNDEVAYGSKGYAGGSNLGYDEVAFGQAASKEKVLAVKDMSTFGSHDSEGDSEGEDAQARRATKGKGKLELKEKIEGQQGTAKVQGGSKQKSRKGDGLDKPGDVKSTGKKRKSRKKAGESDSEAEALETDLYPREARLRNLTYAAQIFIDIRLDIYVPAEVDMSKDGRSNDGRNKNSMFKDGCGTVGENVIETREHMRSPVGKIPVMVKSKLCHLCDLDAEKARKEDCAFDVGGYFIVRGAEKVLLAQEQLFLQRVTVSQTELGLVASSSGAYIRGTNIFYRTVVSMRKEILKKGKIQVSGPQVCTVRLRGVDGYIPLVVVMRALGVITDKEVLEILCGDLQDHDVVQLAFPFFRHADRELEEFFQQRMKDRRDICDQESALEYIGSRVKGRKGGQTECESAIVALSYLFPAQADLSDSAKAFSLGYMACRLCRCYLGRCDLDDREHLKNKRLDLPGDLLTLEFRNLFGRFKNEVRKRTQKALARRKVDFKLDSTVFTLGFQRAFTTGDWSARGNKDARLSGVVVDLPRINPMSTHGQLRKIRTPVNYIAKATKVRYLHDSHRYRVCILETPDGENCGLVESLALSCFVSGDTPENLVYDNLLVCRMEVLDNISTQWLCSHVIAYKVFLNGKWVGCHLEPDKLVNGLRTLRREDKALAEVEIVPDKKLREIRIYTDAGRMLRPLLIVENGSLKFTPRHLAELQSGREHALTYLLEEVVLEFLGVEEEEGALIAPNTKELEKAQDDPFLGSFTHLELHDLLLVGLGASVIPFFNHNPSTRDMQQAQKHGKQAIGNYSTNRKARSDTSSQELFYPQNQLVKTGAAASLQKDELVNGQNVIVAVACYTGYNQEDSLIMNQSSLDRGLFRTVHYKTHRSTLKKGSLEEFHKPRIPEKAISKRVEEAYNLVESDGFPYLGARLDEGDIIAGKARPDRDNPEQPIEVKECVKISNRGRVDQVIQTTEEDGTVMAKVRMRSCRRPEIGDKFSSLHGQKGVIGMLFNQEDMPFTIEGIVPDVIINPHAFPSRQTLGQLMESLLGKVVATPPPSGSTQLVGRADATPFSNSLSQGAIFEELHKSGYHRYGKECMYNGHTGSQMEALITIGPTFYQRLTHLVADKVKYRGRGFVNPVTRQPIKEREKHGAVKFGAMERDCMMAHGAAMTVRERTFVESDFYKMYLCKKCHMPAYGRNPTCRICHHSKDIVQVELPYACKLLQQELFSMSISLKIITEPY